MAHRAHLPSVATGAHPRQSWRLISVLVIMLWLTSTVLVSAQSADDATAQDGDAVAGEGGAAGAMGILAFDDPDNFTLAGRLGIGTETPAFAVDARENRNGISRLRLLNSNAGASATADLYVQTAGTGQGIALTKFGAGHTGVWSGQPLANRAWLRSDTNVTGLILATGGNAPLIFGANNVEWMRLNPNGNVGIGTTNPSTKLEVVGNLKLTGVAGNPGDLLLDNPIYGYSGVALTGSSDGTDTLVLNAVNTFGGGVLIQSHAKVANNLVVGGFTTLGANLLMNAGPTSGDGGRALVHDGGDTLTINYANDFAGGVRTQSKLEVLGDLRLSNGPGGPGDLLLNNTTYGYSGVALTGSGDGSDTLVLNAVNTFAGGVLIQSHAKVANGLVVGGFTTLGSDLLMNSGPSRGDGGRALVHDGSDTLALNYNGDFAGGVRVDSAMNVRAMLQTDGLVIDGGSLTPGSMLTTDASGNLNLKPSHINGNVFVRDGDTNAGIRFYGGGINRIQSVDTTGVSARTLILQPDGGSLQVGEGPETGDKLNVVGTTRTDVLIIDGGADLAEPFVITAEDTVEPGTVAILDADNPGQLRVSATAYDPLVAGIVSGAGGINPGLIMQQEDATIDGESHPIALTGKVYVKAVGPVKIGDLLTTSDLPGHAMAATDRDRAFGATLGKAMSKLDEGTGLVLVLVTLQ